MCRDDTKLSHLASTGLFHPLTGTRHVTVLRLCCCLCFVLGVFWFALVCFLVFFRLLSVLCVSVFALGT